MSLFSAFALSFGALLALQAVIAAWLFKTASAPLWQKIVIPAGAVALGCYAPFAVATMMGYPAVTAERDLPETAELVAFVAHDQEKTVDLWLASGPEPRAYATVLTAKFKQTLRAAAEQLNKGERVMLTRKGKKGAGAKPGAAGGPVEAPSSEDDDAYAVDPKAFAMPDKGAP